jgi:hypothetical protein
MLISECPCGAIGTISLYKNNICFRMQCRECGKRGPTMLNEITAAEAWNKYVDISWDRPYNKKLRDGIK